MITLTVHVSFLRLQEAKQLAKSHRFSFQTSHLLPTYPRERSGLPFLAVVGTVTEPHLLISAAQKPELLPGRGRADRHTGSSSLFFSALSPGLTTL